MRRLFCFAHRGASGHAPENTLAAFAKALSLGADGIELDVYTVEGEVVVIHSERLESTTSGSGRVVERSLSYLRSLDAGRGERIPTLREVLDLVDRRAVVNVELKGPGTAGPVVDLLDEYASRGWPYDRFLVSSFNHGELAKVTARQPRLPIGALITGIPLRQARFAEELGASSVHVSMPFINRPFIRDAHKRRLKVFVYTVNDTADLDRMASLGVDGVFTDYPERVVSPVY